MDVDLYPNQGEYFTLNVPEEQEMEEAQEKAEVFSATPILQAVIAHLKARIDFYNTNEGISEDILLDPVKFMHVVAANKLTVETLTLEKESLELLIEQYKD